MKSLATAEYDVTASKQNESTEKLDGALLEFTNANLNTIHDDNQYEIFVMTVNGIESFRVASEINLNNVSKVDLLELSGYSGDKDEVINVMCSGSAETTALNHYQLEVITDSAEQCSFSFEVQSQDDLTTLLPTQLIPYIDESQITGEIFHICCKRSLH